MVYEFERTIDDIIDFNLFHMTHSPSLKRQTQAYRVLASMLIFFVPVSVALFSGNSVSSFNLIFGFLMGLLFFVVYPYLTRRSVKRRIQKMLSEGENKTMLGHCRMTLLPEGISTKTEHSEGRIDWSAIIKIAESEKHVYLYTGSINAFVVPRTAFENDEAKQEFLDYVSTNAKVEALS